jgi:type VII secretion-associated serine protease mycosin
MSRIVAAILTSIALMLAPSLADPVRDAQWQLDYLRVAEAHAFNTGEGVTVAVIDTGVDGQHPDLAASLVAGVDLTPEGLGDGRTDADGHGTAEAGLIAGNGRVLGIAPGAKIQSVRVAVGGFASGTRSEGINWAIDHGAKVLCVASAERDNPALRDAVRRAIQADLVVVAGVGNAPTSTSVGFPAAYPGVIAAAAIDRNGNHADISVSGPQTVLSAPGVQVMSTDRLDAGNGYSIWTGTSEATAIIAGGAALVRSKYPNLSATEVIHRLTATADDKGPPGRDNDYGYGVVNLVKALTTDVPPLQSPTPNPPSATTPAAQPPADGATPWGLVGLVLLLLLAAGGFVVWRVRR